MSPVDFAWFLMGAGTGTLCTAGYYLTSRVALYFERRSKRQESA